MFFVIISLMHYRLFIIGKKKKTLGIMRTKNEKRKKINAKIRGRETIHLINQMPIVYICLDHMLIWLLWSTNHNQNCFSSAVAVSSILALATVEKCHQMGVNVGIFCTVFLLATQAIGVPALSPFNELHGKKHHSKGTLLLFSAIHASSSFLVLLSYLDFLLFFCLVFSSDLSMDKGIAESIVYSSQKSELCAWKVI